MADKKRYPDFGILLIDDEQPWLNALSLTLRSSAGIDNIALCQDSRNAMSLLAERAAQGNAIGVVLLDLNMPHLSGETLLEEITEHHPDVITIVISGLNQIETAVRCMKLGAFDYFVKTDEEDRIIGGLMRAIRMVEMRREYRSMSEQLKANELAHPEVFADIITADRKMFTVFSYLEAVARSPQPLLITGESGVGKELLVQATHVLSGCTGKKVTVNVAGLDDAVFADTLFGHVRGAFTGADTVRRGMVEEAAGGTLFLDEIGDMSLASQIKLLRLLQEGEYFPLGSDQPKRLQARVIVATHQNLAAKEASGSFRHDLYYRLRIHQVQVPPLRERQGDIALLLEAFLEEAAQVLGKKVPTPPAQLLSLLQTYAFPGNVRELKAMVFDAVSAHRDKVLSMDSFIHAMGLKQEKEKSDEHRANTMISVSRQNPFAGFAALPSFSETATLLVEEAMMRTHNNQTMAARLLGISQPALNKRLKNMQTLSSVDATDTLAPV